MACLPWIDCSIAVSEFDVNRPPAALSRGRGARPVPAARAGDHPDPVDVDTPGGAGRNGSCATRAGALALAAEAAAQYLKGACWTARVETRWTTKASP